MRYPIACTLLKVVKDSRGVVEEDQYGRPLIEEVPGFIVDKNFKIDKEGKFAVYYEIVEMTGETGWYDENCFRYVMDDINHRYRRVMQ